MPSMIKSEDYICITMDDGTSFTVSAADKIFGKVAAAAKNKNFVLAQELASPAKRINGNCSTGIEVIYDLDHEGVYYNGELMHGTLVDRILDMTSEGWDVFPMVAFLENLLQNPSARAVEELYGFLEVGHLPITEDGHFLAYKRISEDWLDVYTRTISNRIGDIVTMPRERVTADSNQTCAAGLHFCSREYLKHFTSGRLVMIKINPRDVVSIPNDYNNTKGRCCRYEVLAEISEGSLLERAYVDTTSPSDDLNIKQIYFASREKAREFCQKNRAYKVIDRGSQSKSGSRWLVKRKN